MATSQEVIKKLRDAGISEDVIAKKVTSLGGTYTPPVSPTSVSNQSLGAPQSGTMPQQQKGLANNPIIKFLAGAPARLGQGIGNLASNLVNPIGYAKDPSTQALQQKALQMADEAERKGDLEGARRLREVANKSQSTNEGIVSERKLSNQEAGEDILKGGVGTAAYLLPGSIATKYLGKAGGAIASGTLGGGMTGFGLSERGNELSDTLTGGVTGGAFSAVGQGLKWLGGKITPKIIQTAGSSENKIIKKFGQTVSDLSSKYGKNADELLGPIEEKNRGGTFGKGLQEAESVIQDTIDTAGTNIKIGGDEVLKALKKELKVQKVGMDDDVVKGLEKIIKSFEKRYKKGMTAKQALTILRQANSKYGKAMATSPQGSTTKLAQLTIAETLRDVLKETFPELKDALTAQSEILTLRPIIEKVRANAVSKAGQGIITKSFDVTRPTTYPIVQDLIGASNKVVPSLLKGAGAVAGSPAVQRGVTSALVSPEPAPTTAPQAQPDTGALPSPTQPTQPTQEPILSEGGQWRWDATQNDWVPNEQAQNTQDTRTGYTEQQIYDAMLMAQQAGDSASYAQLRQMYEDEADYQKSIGGGKKTEAQITRDQVAELTESAYQDLLTGKVKTGMFKGPIEQLKSKVGKGDQATLEFQNKIFQIKAMISKVRAGTALSPQEKKMLDSYTPSDNDSYQQLELKLRGLLEDGVLESLIKESGVDTGSLPNIGGQ